MLTKREGFTVGRLFLAIVVLSIVTGFGGIGLHHLLDWVENLSFGAGEAEQVNFVAGTSALRRGVVILLAAILGSLSWYLLQRNSPIRSISYQLKNVQEKPPFWQHIGHVLLQIVTVGMGSPIGKEGAPRELGALFAGRIGNWLRLDRKDQKLLVACGAGAGLAAVYQVPLASVFFVIETLGVPYKTKNLLALLLSTYLSSAVTQLALKAEPIYQINQLNLSFGNLLVSVFIALLVAPIATLFHLVVKKAGQDRVKNIKLLYTLPVAFFLLAIASIWWPQILGNGQMMAQDILNGLSWQRVLILFVLKAMLVCICLRAGAYGGVLTPSFALGISLGFLFGIMYQLIFPEVSLPTAMLAGATAFLSVNLNAPLAAIGLVVGFSGQDWPAYLPLLLASLLANRLFRLMTQQSWLKFLN